MKVKNGEIVNAVGALNKLMEVKLPVKTSFQIAKLAGKVKDPLEAFNKVRDGLVKTYGVTSEPGKVEGTITLKTKKPEDLTKFADEMDELLNLEVELVVETIKLPEKVDGIPFCLEPSILMALEKFVEP